MKGRAVPISEPSFAVNSVFYIVGVLPTIL